MEALYDLQSVVKDDLVSILAMTFQAGAFSDMFGNPTPGSQVALDLPSSAIDIKPPSLLSWELNMNTGTIKFLFDDLVQPDTLDISKVTLRSSGSTAPLRSIQLGRVCCTPSTRGTLPVPPHLTSLCCHPLTSSFLPTI